MTQEEGYRQNNRQFHPANEADAIAAQSVAIDALLAAGFTDPEQTGRDPSDPIQMTSPLGAIIEIGIFYVEDA